MYHNVLCTYDKYKVLCTYVEISTRYYVLMLCQVQGGSRNLQYSQIFGKSISKLFQLKYYEDVIHICNLQGL